MAYANTWSTSIPAGTLAANQIDTAIQQTRLDIAQRINTILGANGSMSSDPVLDDTTCKSLTLLTTELATKTTLSGLTAGTIPKATGAGSIGNSSLTEAALAAMLAAYTTPLQGTSTTNTTNANKFTIVPGAVGVYIATFYGSPASALTYAEIKTNGSGETFENYTTPSATVDFSMTAIFSITTITDDFQCNINSNIGGTYNVRWRKLM